MKPSIKYEIKPLWLDIEYKGKIYHCHRDSWMARVGIPIQEIPTEILEKIVFNKK